MNNCNILLVGINAKFIHSTPAIYCLKAYADHYCTNRPEGCSLSLAEYTINQPVSSILADIYVKKPDIIAFSCYIWNWETVQDILLELPKLLPNTPIWLGGPEVSFHAEKILSKYPQLTGIMIGEGEETFRELSEYYWTGRPSLPDIKGIVYSGGFTGVRAPIDIDSLPFPYSTRLPDILPPKGTSAGDSMPISEHTILEHFDNRIIYYESQRGCPFHCSYCLSSIHTESANTDLSEFHASKVRLRNLNTVLQELQLFLKANVKQVKFIDRTFNCNAAHATAIWRFLQQNDNGITNFHFEIAADLLTEEQLAIMEHMRPGLIQLEIGVQSTHLPTLKAICRRMDIHKLRENVAKIHSGKNIHQHLDLIAGLPFEDYDTFAKSFHEVYEMAPNQLQLGFLKVLKGSPMEQAASEYGIVYQTKPPYEVLYTKWLPYENMLSLKNIEEMVERYYNSGQFTHTLSVLAQEFTSPFKMYEALADYYQKNGYFVNAPARAYRYQVLLEFASSISPDKRQLYAELLTFDIYLRENIKSRPAFAPEYTLPKSALRQFYEQEAKESQYLKGYDGLQAAQLARMTHIEDFSYAVWNENPAECVKRLNKNCCVLFDYKNRDILTHDAVFFVMERELFLN